MKIKKYLSLAIAVILLAGSFAFPNPVGAEETVAKRTIMLYLCASNLEENGGMATFNLKQALGADFSKNEDVNLIVYSGGARKWQPEIEAYLEGADTISTEHNQIWQLYGADAPEHASKMVLLETSEKQSKYELMTDPSVLTGFIDYCALNYPAEKYDLIFWDHGSGPVGGYGADMHYRELTEEEAKTAITSMTIPRIMQALQNSSVSKFGIVDFDCCLMGNLEIAAALSDLSDYLIISPENEPGYGQEYSCWLNFLGEDSSVDSYTLGKSLVDGFKVFYESEENMGTQATLTLVDTEKLLESDLLTSCANIAAEMSREAKEASFYDEIRSGRDSVKYGNSGLYDLGNFIEQLGVKIAELTEEDMETNYNFSNAYTDDAMKVSEFLRDPTAIYAVYTGDIGSYLLDSYIRDEAGNLVIPEDEIIRPTGLSIYFEADRTGDKTLTGDYIRDMKNAVQMLPDTNVKAKAFLEKEMEAARDYDLIQRTGNAVSTLVKWEMAPAEIDYEDVKKVWLGYTWENNAWTAPEEDLDSVWERWVETLMEGKETETKLWLEDVISVQKTDTVKTDRISAVKVNGDNGKETFRIVLEDTNRFAVGGAGIEVYAELPQLSEYLEMKATPEEKKAAESVGLTTDLKIGTIEGEENLEALKDFDNWDSKAFIDWYKGPVSVWNLDEYDDTWYALKDAGGILHGVYDLDNEEDGRSYVTAYYEENGERTLVWLGFMQNENGGFEAPDVLYIDSDGGGKMMNVSDLTEELVLTACMILDSKDGTFYLPISDSSFILSKETAPVLSLAKYSISQIPEIGDVDGDGVAAKHIYTMEDFYHCTYDIDQQIHDAPAKQQNNFKVSPTSEEFKAKKLKKKKKM